MSDNGIELAKQRAAKKRDHRGQRPVARVRLAAAQRPDLELRHQQLPDGRRSAGVRRAVLERRCDQPVGDADGRFPRPLRRRLPSPSPARSRWPGTRIDLTKVDADLFILGGVTDHITPWRATLSFDPVVRRQATSTSCSASRATCRRSSTRRAIPRRNTSCRRSGGPLPADGRGMAGRGPRKWPAAGGPTGSNGSRSVRAPRRSAPPKRWAARSFAPIEPAPGLYVLEQA